MSQSLSAIDDHVAFETDYRMYIFLPSPFNSVLLRGFIN